MASPNNYIPPQQQQYFQTNHLPSPAELGLSYPSRTNARTPTAVTQSAQRYPPASSYNHPSLSTVAGQISSQLPTSPAQGWGTRTSGSSNGDTSPTIADAEVRSKMEEEDLGEPSTQMDQTQSRVKHEGGEDGMPATSDFVKKLYKMLEDNTFTDIVCWGPQGDCFVIKDLNEFTKSILPRMFKHSNFASFVRQLNKYDFHKVKSTDDNQFGEHCWIFRHPDFHINGRDSLENIKRKVPGNRKQSQFGSTPPPNTANVMENLRLQMERMGRQQDEMTAHIRTLESDYENVVHEMMSLQRNLTQQDGVMQNLIQYFVQLENAKLNARAQGQGRQLQGGYGSDGNPFLQVGEAQQLLNGVSYPDSDLARASLLQMNEISRRAEMAGMTFSTAPGNNRLPSSSSSAMPGFQTQQQGSFTESRLQGALPPGGRSKQQVLARIAELSRTHPTSGNSQSWMPDRPGSPSASLDGSAESSSGNPPPSSGYEASGPAGGSLIPRATNYGVQATSATLSHEGLQVYTVGHLMPRSTLDDQNGNWTFDPNLLNGIGPDDASGSTSPDVNSQSGVEKERQQASIEAEPGTNARPATPHTIRVRRSTYVPLWSVPPKVLIVDDDAISRKLGSKFLQVFGCTTDIAVDGVSAVNKMNLEKYDLVLMDIVMPKLDGISATSLIRQFDHMTPIISMTSNAQPNQIIKYYSSGMNDVLPKPFTRDGLLGMLEKHLIHLKAIRNMAQLPRSVGIPPLSDPSFAEALTTQAAKLVATAPRSNPNDGRVNPLAAMGLSDEQYTTILQNLVNGEAFEDIMAAGPSALDNGKRPMPDSPDGPDSKRSRFEEIE